MTDRGKRVGLWLGLTGAGLALFASPALAAFPGDNGRIAFGFFDPGTASTGISSMDPDGGNRTSLTDGAGRPAYSADGTKIAFASVLHPGGREIYTMNADGSDPQRLTNNADEDTAPAFSPDGARIAFQSSRDGGSDIYVMDADGTDVTRLTTDGNSATPSFSPDGSQIVFESPLGIDVMNADGSSRIHLAAGAHPDFSPGGNRIVFERGEAGGNSDIHVMHADGTNVTQLTHTPLPAHEVEPSFSPDGTKIVFRTDRDGPELGDNEIYTMDADGSNETRRTTSAVFEAHPDWQPIPVDCPPDTSRGRAESSTSPATEVAEFARSRRSMAADRSLVQARGDGGGGRPRLAEVVPGEAVAGAVVLIQGRNLAARGLHATVGGERARITRARDRSLLVKVPRLAPGVHRLVLRRGDRRASDRLRVLRPFDGTPNEELDSANATSATIGPAGGGLSTAGADGTSYELQIPPGALGQNEAISLTPVKRFKGLPFTGGDVAGVELGPDGLRLQVPAQLTIRGAGAFDGSTIGFGEGEEGLETSEPDALGRRLVLSIGHFSSHGASEAELADAANLLQPFLAHRGNLSLNQIREMLRLLAIFDRRFSPPQDQNRKPPSWCSTQPICRQAIEKAQRSLEGHIRAACERGASTPTIHVFREILDLQPQLDLLGGNDRFSIDCRDRLAKTLATKVLTALGSGSDPLARFREFELPAGVSGDIDGDGDISAWEMAEALAGEFDFLGPVEVDGETSDLSQLLREARSNGLETIILDNTQLCRTDAAAGIRNLRKGLAYARRIGEREAEILAALDACGVSIVVVPAQVELEPGDQQLFEAVVTNPGGEDLGGVAWSSTGGQLGPDGLFARYTAPSSAGAFSVTATSTKNPERSSTARITVVDDDC